MSVLNSHLALTFLVLLKSGTILGIARGEDVSFTVGVVCDRGGRMSAESPFVNHYNESADVKVTWYYIDCEEPFQVVKALKLLDAEPSYDAIVLQCHVTVPLHRILEKRTKKILKINTLPELINTKPLHAEENGVNSQLHCYRSNQVTFDERYSQMQKCNDDSPVKLMATVVFQLQWKRVDVFYDKNSGTALRLLSEHLSLKRILLSFHDIDGINNLNDYIRRLYDTVVSSQHELNAIVVCERACMFRILKTAGVFDSANTDQQTMLCFLSKWLLLVPGFTDMLRDKILTHIGCLYNVAVLTIPNNQLQDTRVFQQLLNNVIGMTSFYTFGKGNSSTLEMADTFSMDLLSADPSYTCDGYLIDTVYHKKTGRAFRTVGYTDLHSHVTLLSEVFPNTNFGYNQKVFKVTTLEICKIVYLNGNKYRTLEILNYNSVRDAVVDQYLHFLEVPKVPFLMTVALYNDKSVFKLFETHTGIISYSPFVITRDVKNRTVYEGPFIDLLDELSRSLNFSYTLSSSPDGKWGSIERWDNGTPIFNGLIGQIQRRECDFAAAPLSIHPTRELVVDFSYPVYHEYTSVLVRSMDAESRKWRTLLNPLKTEVLLAIGAVIPVITVILFVLETFGAGIIRNRTGTIKEVREIIEQRHKGLVGARDAIWCTLGTFLGQGGMQMPVSFSGSTLMVTWWLFGIVIVGTYCGNLIAFLTVTKVTLPFNTLQEMATKQDDYRWGVAGGTNLEIIFKTSTSPELRGLGDAMLRFNQSDSGIFDTEVARHIERVKLEKYAYIGETTEVKLAMLKSCDLMKMKEEFLPVKNAFVFQETSPHTRIFSKQIMKIEEAGLFEMWRRKWWPKSSLCLNEEVSARSKPIALSDVQGAFYICLLGIVIGTITLGIEIISYRLRLK